MFQRTTVMPHAEAKEDYVTWNFREEFVDEAEDCIW